MIRCYDHYLLDFAIENRNNPTPAEAILWEALRANRLGIRCKRQVPIGSYIADFAFKDAKIIIEVDGGYHGTVEQRAKDSLRTQALQRHGYRVCRVKNQQVYDNLPRVLAYIKSKLPPRYKKGLGRFLVPLSRTQ